MKRKSPKLSYLENARFENDIEYIGLEINENPKEKMILNDMTFDSCIFNKIDFSNMILNKFLLSAAAQIKYAVNH